ncbi:hypothetical protein BHE74_00001240 [Ensete ventricosum]|nr:hypothetical protein GW17_00016944 [Ensete ventricosum]RWW89727.1 hypothetical protein BHE74_00001240 [Ensete ventricosum]RZR79404.1 hypothetical protein BHM03_00005121 [Ensete ventricosum]
MCYLCPYRRTMGLHRAVALCMDHCLAAEVASDDRWFKTVVLAGGSACLPGLPVLTFHMVWIQVSTFANAWCISKKQFRQRLRRNKAW